MSWMLSLIDKIPLGHPAGRGFWLYSKTPQSLMGRLQGDHFRHTVRYVYAHSPFYKRNFDRLGIRVQDVQKPEDLGDFYTTAEDIRQNPEEFICQRPDTAYETTGTTSKKTKRVYFSRKEILEAGWAGAVGLWGVGVRPRDRIASAFDYSFWVSGPVLTASCGVLGAFHVEAGRMDVGEFYDRLRDYRLSVIVGDPSWLLALTHVAEKKGAWPLKLLMGGGENFTEEARRYVESVWKADFILSYGQTEAFGAIGMESLAKEGYHLNEFHNAFEILRPDKDGYGELVYTTMNRRVMPLVRYRSGDLTRFLGVSSAKNALPGRRIEKLKGRVDEWVATAMGNIAPWMFEPIFSNLPEAAGDWQIVVEKDQQNQKDLISLCLEARGDASALEQRLLANFKSAFPEAWHFEQNGHFKIQIKILPQGSLRTTRKLLHLLDKRKY